MARKTQPPVPPSPAKLSLDDKRRGTALLKKRLAEVKEFNVLSASEHEITALESSIEEALERVFGKTSSDYQRYSAAGRFDWGPISMGGTWGRSGRDDRSAYVVAGRDRSIALLTAAIKILDERIADEATEAEATQPTLKARPRCNEKIFIVHGHDEAMREAVARFVERLGFEAIILGEQANKGRTIIEKFEGNSDVGFAIVLLSPDDVGGVTADSLAPRARQNVILELGYFIGKLTREHVCALVRDRQVETPSDTHGIVWIYWDSPWQLLLAKELKSAGYEVDMNALV